MGELTGAKSALGELTGAKSALSAMETSPILGIQSAPSTRLQLSVEAWDGESGRLVDSQADSQAEVQSRYSDASPLTEDERDDISAPLPVATSPMVTIASSEASTSMSLQRYR